LTPVNFPTIAIPDMTTQDEALSQLLHAIADPTRRKILQALKAKNANSLGKDTGLCARDIEERVHVSQPTISHHMSILEKAGLVETQKQAQWRWYRRDEKAIREFAKSLRETL
jgi:ArsR family transcriptional regulator